MSERPIDVVGIAGELHVVRHLQRLFQRRFDTQAVVRVTKIHEPPTPPLIRSPVLLGGVVVGSVEVEPPSSADARDLDLLIDLVDVLAAEIGLAIAERQVDVVQQPTRYRYDEIIGRGEEMRALQRTLDKVVEADATVLVQGENGTGKELIARAIHFNSQRSAHHFVATNCSAFNDNLLDSELFGHKKGAFTGAVVDKPGLFELADRGTFFLDEIGDMSPSLQVKVLRVIQEGTFTAVGDTQSRRVDVRIIAATHRDLRQMVDRGEFREDLYYRVNVINLVVPPLRERRDDIPVLVGHFLERAAAARGEKKKRLARSCLDRLLAHSWPGNVRELENEIERLVVLAGDAKVIGEELLSPRIVAAVTSADRVDEGGSLREARERIERGIIGEVLSRHRWNKTRAAEELGMSRRNLIRKVDRYKLDSRTRGKRERTPS